MMNGQEIYVRGFDSEGRRVWISRQGEAPETYDGVVIFENGTVEHWKDGVLHNEDGPAIIGSSGMVEYWVHGERHRIDGPAIIYPDSGVAYYVNDVLHPQGRIYRL